MRSEIAQIVQEAVPTAPLVARDRFERLYRDHHQAVLGYCRRRTSAQDARDAVAETFTVAWRRLDQVPEGDGTLPWLFAVAYRVVGHRWRQLRRERKLSQKLRTVTEVANPGPELQIVRSREHDQVIHAADRLSRRDREILRLRVWEELSYAEIAVVLGTGVEAAKQRFHRAKERLAAEYDRLDSRRPGLGSATPGGHR